MKYQKLPKEFKQKWVKALRSGKYKKGIGSLYYPINNSYCCLGVACHMVSNRNPPESSFIEPGKNIKGVSRIPDILKWDKKEGGNVVVRKLVHLNDTKGWSFKRIATWIDKYL